MPEGGILAIFAHPDDETFGVGATVARYADRGVPVTMVSATRGEVGEISPGTGATPETLADYREQELRDAMTILGVSDVRFLGFRDSGMKGTAENEHPDALMNAAADDVVEAMVRLIRETRPRIVVTWDESGGYGHPDHIAVHFHAKEAFSAAADASRYAGAGAAWQANALYYTAIPMQEFGRLMQEMQESGIMEPNVAQEEGIDDLPRVEPNCVIDVRDQFERKERAMVAHRTQISDMNPFMKLPVASRLRFFGREWFHRAHPPVADGVMLDDLFAGLE
ncbi:MAG: PIG-L family deacetylase [Dehalococcoidia bacterium]